MEDLGGGEKDNSEMRSHLECSRNQEAGRAV